MSEKILFVDDDKNLLAGCERHFRKQFRVDTAEGSEEGLKKIESNGPYAVVVSDRQMPGMDGTQFLATVRQRAPDTVRMMLTGNIDLEAAVRTVNEGNIFRFLIKPTPPPILGRALEDAVAQHRLIMAEKELLTKTLNGSIKLLTDILAHIEPQSFGRTEQLRSLINQVAAKINFEKAWEVSFAAMLSAIGIVTLPPELVSKACSGKALTKLEEQMLRNVPETTAKLLSNIPRLESVATIIRYSEKNFDGTGIPEDDLSEEMIPAGSRLLKILSDAVHLQNTGLSLAAALTELTRRDGWYDPRMLLLVCEACGLTKPFREGAHVISVAVSDLTIGMRLTSDVMTQEGTLVLSAGHQINGMVLGLINNFDRLSGIKEPLFVESPHTEETH